MSATSVWLSSGYQWLCQHFARNTEYFLSIRTNQRPVYKSRDQSWPIRDLTLDTEYFLFWWTIFLAGSWSVLNISLCLMKSSLSWSTVLFTCNKKPVSSQQYTVHLYCNVLLRKGSWFSLNIRHMSQQFQASSSTISISNPFIFLGKWCCVVVGPWDYTVSSWVAIAISIPSPSPRSLTTRRKICYLPCSSRM